MRLSIISFTEKGGLLSEKLAEAFRQSDCVLYTKCSLYRNREQGVQFVAKEIGEWAGEQMKEKNALLFIGACGIAVRAIAPHITDKLHDSPVLVMDEKGQYIIPLLAGHVGGANELAAAIAKKTGAVPVITTATDINHQFAVDLFAGKNGLGIENKEGIAKVSAKVLAGKSITMAVENGHLEDRTKLPEGVRLAEYPPLQRVDIVVTSEDKSFETAVLLRAKEYVLGVGCRKGKEADKIQAFLTAHLQKAGISSSRIFGMASIDVKKEEPGLLAFCRKAGISFLTYTAEELRAVEGEFHRSEFVREKVLVDNVCERAALKMSGAGGRLVYEKHAEDGMTIAIAKREWRVSFDEE